MNLAALLKDESKRNHEFPSTKDHTFMAHGGVTVLPRVAADALCEFAQVATRQHQESGSIWAEINETRVLAARLMGAQAEEISLLGPTALGLNLVANGITWNEGDEVVFYQDDYPANVYPWLKLSSQGVKPVPIQPEHQGFIDWPLLEKHITPKTRLVGLASANFLTGYRIDIDQIGRNLRERGILFCLDGIQTLGAFPTTVEHVDFLSADSHKWMLGPIGSGVFYVKKEHFDLVQPTLLGSWNVYSPDFIAQESIGYYPGGRRYEPGSLNIPGILGMKASLELLLSTGVETISNRILELRASLIEKMETIGYPCLLEGDHPELPDSCRSGLITFRLPADHPSDISDQVSAQGVSVSWRNNRKGDLFMRCSPHFYNTEEDLDRLVTALKSVKRTA